MKKYLITLLLGMVAFVASAASVGTQFTVDKLTYQVVMPATATDYAQVTVTGLSAEGKSVASLHLQVPSTVLYDGVRHKVRNVGVSAFANQSNIQSVTLNYGITSLSGYSFMNCANLAWVRIPSSVTSVETGAFSGCSSLKIVYAANPNPTTHYVNGAFPNNKSMLVVVPRTHPNTVERYRALPAFANFNVYKSYEAYDIPFLDGANYCVTKAPTKTTAGELTMVGIRTSSPVEYSPASGSYYAYGYNFNVTAIADSACHNSQSLATVDLSNLNYLTTIGEAAFSDCVALTSLEIGTSSLKTIKARAFSGCTSLYISLYIPSGVTYCDHTFVDGCVKLVYIYVRPGNQSYDSYGGMLYDKSLTTLIRRPEGYPEGRLIASDCPTTLRVIGEGAFLGSQTLYYVELPYGVTTIYEGAFSNCKKLHTVSIPSTLSKWIGNPFAGTTALTYLFVNRTTPPSLPSTAFSDAVRTCLYVPYSAISTYQKAVGWKTWKNFRSGAYDVGMMSRTSTFFPKRYSILSDKPETIHGKAYAGRARLVSVPDPTHCEQKYDVPDDITLPNGKKYAVTSIGSEVCGIGIEMSTTAVLTLGANIDTICNYAFMGQSRLVGLNFNANLTNIGHKAFYNCGIANDLDLPYGVLAIGSGAFYGNSFKRILVPSSVNTINYDFVAQNTKLQEFVLNKTNYDGLDKWDFSGIPSSCKLYVPMGCYLKYKNNEKWGKFNVIDGAYDFTFQNKPMGSTQYYITVTDNTPFTLDGMEYAGKAKYVYNPLCPTEGITTFIASTAEKYMANGADANYLMTEFDENALQMCANIKTVNISHMTGLERIGKRAFFNTGITSFTVPASCTYIGEDAFEFCKDLKELIISEPASGAGRTWGGQFYSHNASDFKCYVMWTSYSAYKNSIAGWKKYTDEANTPLDRLNAYFVSESSQPAAISIGYPVDWKASGLNAYTVNAYNKFREKAYTKKVEQTQAGVGLIIDGFIPNVICRLRRPTATPATGASFLTPVGGAPENIYLKTGAFMFDRKNKCFYRPTSTAYLSSGYSYLSLPDSQVENTTRITIDLWESVVGDINADGVVNVSDVTALINRILGTADYSDAVCDINADGVVNVSDVTALINMILGN